MHCLSAKEQEVTDWYDQNASLWSEKRREKSKPSFWDQEYREFEKLFPKRGKILPPGRVRKVLEIGSGSGREAIEWIRMGYEYHGIDLSRNLIEIARQTEPKGHYSHTSLYELAFPPHTFDAFSSWALLSHIPKERMGVVLAAIRRVVKRGAIGFIAMREGEGEKREEETGRWFSYYTQAEFSKVLEGGGFEILQMGKRRSRKDLTWLIFFVKK